MKTRLLFVIFLASAVGAVFIGGACRVSKPSGPSASAVMVKKDGMPIVDQRLSLTGVASKGPNHEDWNKILMFETYEKLSNIHVEWAMIPQTSYVEKRNILIASNDLPDLFLRGQFSSIDEATFGNQGVLIALNSLIDNYAPNFSAILKQRPEVRPSISQVDGNIYTLPQLNVTMGNLVSKIWIRDPWLQKLGLSKPATLDEFYTTALKFKTSDANGNGIADEIPISGAYKGTTGTYLSKIFSGSFGFGRVGGTYTAFVDVDAGGKMQFVPFNPKYREVLQYLNKLYAAGLIDPEIYTLDTSRFMAKAEEGNIGMVLHGSNYQWIGAAHMREYSSVTPMKGPDGSAPYWGLTAPFVQNTGTAAITQKNGHPEATMRYLDYFYSLEGTKLVRLGVEGVTYEKGPDGKYQYMDWVSHDPQGRTTDRMVGTFTIFPGGGMPQMITDDIDLSAAQWPDIKASTDNYLPFLPQEYLRLSFTQDEINELNALSNDILTYIEEQEIKFTTGTENFSNWNTFMVNLERMNAKRYTEIYDAAYQRWRTVMQKK